MRYFDTGLHNWRTEMNSQTTKLDRLLEEVERRREEATSEIAELQLELAGGIMPAEYARRTRAILEELGALPVRTS